MKKSFDSKLEEHNEYETTTRKFHFSFRRPACHLNISSFFALATPHNYVNNGDRTN